MQFAQWSLGLSLSQFCFISSNTFSSARAGYQKEYIASLAYFCVGLLPTLCHGPRTLFICPREKSACHVVFIWRSVSGEDFIPISVFTHRIVRRPFLFSAVGFWRTYTIINNCFPGLFVSKVRISHFPFSRVLCVL